MDARPSAVIVAAGASRRMGRTKALLPLRGRPLVAWHVERLRVCCARVVVVAGAHAGEIRGAIDPRAEVVVNAAWDATEMIDSVRLGLGAVDGPCLVLPVDVAPPAPATLGALCAATATSVPRGPGGDGHPVLLDAALVAQLRAERPERGLRDWLVGAARVDVADPWVAADFDAPAAWDAFALAWGG